MVCKNAVERRISAYKFALYDLALYLDSHPCDQEAFALQQSYRIKLKELIDLYEQHYGPYVCTMSDVQENWSEWAKDPWPWDVVKGDGNCVAI